MLDCAVFVTC